MRSVFGVCLVGACTVILAQACGSDDDSKKSPRKVPPSAQGGDSAAGESSTGTSGSKSGSGSGGTGGSSSGGTAGTSPSEAGAGGDPQVGSAGEGGSGQGNAGGQGGASSEAGAGGASEAVTCELASTCSGTLAAVGTGDFSIAFTLTTSTTARSGVISQRAVCMHSKFWDVRLGTGAQVAVLSIELDDQSNYTFFNAPATFTDGQPHEVRICRKAGHVYAFSDGVLVGDAASLTNFTTLPALATSSTTCNALDGTVTLDGSVTGVCVGAL